ncbi:MAG: hypothetical protein HUJ68_04135 [Clostridia bacterium]|nr:hypothetical protein [Clostridia bacterium]
MKTIDDLKNLLDKVEEKGCISYEGLAYGEEKATIEQLDDFDETFKLVLDETEWNDENIGIICMWPDFSDFEEYCKFVRYKDKLFKFIALYGQGSDCFVSLIDEEDDDWKGTNKKYVLDEYKLSEEITIIGLKTPKVWKEDLFKKYYRDVDFSNRVLGIKITELTELNSLGLMFEEFARFAEGRLNDPNHKLLKEFGEWQERRLSMERVIKERKGKS